MLCTQDTLTLFWVAMALMVATPVLFAMWLMAKFPDTAPEEDADAN